MLLPSLAKTYLQAFQELAKGERAASALENHLDSLEKKIEDLLAKADEDEKKLQAQTQTESPAKGKGTGPS